jgi:undecaprenyl-diphosphatase
VIAPVDVVDVAPPAQDAPRWLPLVGAVGALGAGALVVLSVRTGGSAWPVDRTVHAWVLEHRRSVDTAVAAAVTWLGATSVALPTLAVVGAALPRGRRRPRDRAAAALLLVGTASLGIWLGLLVNQAVGRERPPLADWWGNAGGPAFPSGHTTAATVAAGTLAWALAARVRSPRGRLVLWSSAAVVAMLVGWSRVWLGVHWPSDVLAGWLLGASWVALVVSGVAIAERQRSARRRRPGRLRRGPTHAGAPPSRPSPPPCPGS